MAGKYTTSLCAFSAGLPQFTKALERLHKQAVESKIFDKIFIYNEKTFDDKDFWAKHKDFIDKNPRGYGYWIWKPYVIRKTLLESNTDYVIYMDSGCEINANHPIKITEFNRYLDNASKNLILSNPTLYNPKYREDTYNKIDLIKRLDMESDPNMHFHMEAGLLILKNCPEVLEFVNKWIAIIEEDYHFIDDTKSINPEKPGFLEHRYDQSIFSLLYKKYMFHTNFPKVESYNLLWYARNRTSVSKIPKIY